MDDNTSWGPGTGTGGGIPVPGRGALLAAALSYMDRGWWVFPAFVVWDEEKQRKKPQFPASWKAASSNDPAMALMWFGAAGLYKDAVLCIDCGQSGLAVVDVDVRGSGRENWQAFRARHGDVPETYRVGTPSGGEHWLYAAGEGGLTIDSASKIALGVDFRGDGGLIFAAPSVIEGYGAYRWLEGEPIGGSGDCPVLPRSVVSALRGSSSASRLPFSAAGLSPSADRQTGTAGSAEGLPISAGALPPSAALLPGLAEGLPRLFTQDEAWAFCRERAEAFGALDPRRDGLGRNQKLFELSLQVAHFVGSLWDAGSVHAYLVSLAQRNGMVASHGLTAVEATISSAWGRPRDWVAAPRPFPAVPLPGDQQTTAGTEGQSADVLPDRQPVADGGRGSAEGPLNLPAEFWEAREVFARVRAHAHSRAASGDVALHTVLARLAAMHPAGETLDTGVATPATLNYFAALVGPSGAGKSTGADVGAELLPARLAPHGFQEWPLGTGEGLAEAYMESFEEEVPGEMGGRPKKRKGRRQGRGNALVHSDEGATLNAEMARASSKLGAMLRTAWSGKLLGNMNGTAETTRIVTNYALGLTVGFQPSTALALLAEDQIAMGTPQRFVWVWTPDPAIPQEAPESAGALGWAPRVKRIPAVIPGMATGTWSGPAWCEPAPLEMCAAVRAEIRGEHLAQMRGEVVVGALASQRRVTLIKLAGLLAVLEGRHEVTEEDWQLARVIWDTSCLVRDYVLSLGAEQRAREEEAKTAASTRRATAVRAAELGAEEAHGQTRVERAALLIREKAAQLPQEGQARSDLRREMRRWREEFEEALALAIGQGWARVGGHRILPPG